MQLLALFGLLTESLLLSKGASPHLGLSIGNLHLLAGHNLVSMQIGKRFISDKLLTHSVLSKSKFLQDICNLSAGNTNHIWGYL